MPTEESAAAVIHRRGLQLATLVVAASLVATLAFALVTVHTRLQEFVEGCVLFEASRIRAHLPLYTDPLRGAFDYGPVPARYYVLYPPLWSALLSLLPGSAAPELGRTVGALAWYGPLLWIALGGKRRGLPLALAAAAFVGGVYTLTLYGASARPDSLAVGLAAVALEKSVRAERVTPLAAALFALAAWVKPNVLGLAAGALIFEAMTRRRAALRPFAVAAGASAAVALVLQLASGGAWLTHLRQSTGQPLTLAQWNDQFVFRLQFLGAPIAFAAYCAWQVRARPAVRLALAALAASVAWTCVSIAKMGSATNYFMEPCVAALVIVAHAPVPPLSPRARLAIGVLAPLQAFWTGVASIRSSLEAIELAPLQSAVVDRVRHDLGGGRLALSDDAGIEFRLDARLIDTPFQTSHLVRRGRFPLEAWLADIGRPEVVTLVTLNDVLERSPDDVDPLHDRYPPDLRQALRAEFLLDWHEAGLYVYRRR